MSRHLILIAILSVAFTVSTFADPATTQSTQPATTQAVAAPEGSVAVVRGDLNLLIDLDGTFIPLDAFEAKAAVQGYQGELEIVRSIDPNKPVRQGDVLIQFDPAGWLRQVVAAESELATARANLTKSEADLKLGADSDTLSAKWHAEARESYARALKWWDDSDASAMAESLENQLRTSDFYVESAEDELEQLRKMYKTEDLTSETADLVVKRALRVLDIQKSNRDVQRKFAKRSKELELELRRQALVYQAASGEHEVAALEASQTQARVLRESARIAAGLAVELAEEKLDRLRRDEAIFTLRSPVDGVAIYGMFVDAAWQTWPRKTLAPGERLAAKTMLVTVVQPGKLRLQIDVPERQIGWIKLGLKARVIPSAYQSESYEAMIAQIAPVATGGNFSVLLDLPAVNDQLLPGYKSAVTIDCGTIENAMLVPVESVHRGRAWVSVDGKDEPRDVIVGASDGKQTQVAGGLKEGEFVLKQAKK